MMMILSNGMMIGWNEWMNEKFMFIAAKKNKKKIQPQQQQQQQNHNSNNYKIIICHSNVKRTLFWAANLMITPWDFDFLSVPSTTIY